jgi:hypothetical protein
MRIQMISIPHERQRYNTVGDWRLSHNGIHITVSHTTDDYTFLVGIHEAIEAYLCRKRGIQEEVVTAFDMEFEMKRESGNVDEPGDSVDAPYQREHFFATSVERLIASELGVNWVEYSHAIESFKER